MSIGISIPSPDFCHFPHCSSGAERSKNKVASVKFKVTSIKHEILSGHTYVYNPNHVTMFACLATTTHPYSVTHPDAHAMPKKC